MIDHTSPGTRLTPLGIAAIAKYDMCVLSAARAGIIPNHLHSHHISLLCRRPFQTHYHGYMQTWFGHMHDITNTSTHHVHCTTHIHKHKLQYTDIHDTHAREATHAHSSRVDSIKPTPGGGTQKL